MAATMCVCWASSAPTSCCCWAPIAPTSACIISLLVACAVIIVFIMVPCAALLSVVTCCWLPSCSSGCAQCPGVPPQRPALPRLACAPCHCWCELELRDRGAGVSCCQSPRPREGVVYLRMHAQMHAGSKREQRGHLHVGIVPMQFAHEDSSHIYVGMGVTVCPESVFVIRAICF
jgi:hypothetical protein